MVQEELYHFSVGTVAGMTGMICVFPIGKKNKNLIIQKLHIHFSDSIKTRLQNQRKVSPAMMESKFIYNGYRDCASKVIRFEGFRALYGGWGPACLSEGPKKALRLN